MARSCWRSCSDSFESRERRAWESEQERQQDLAKLQADLYLRDQRITELEREMRVRSTAA